MLKILCLVIFFQSTLFALNISPQQKKSFQIMQLNNQIMQLDQTIQYKRTEQLKYQSELKNINSDLNIVQDLKSKQNSIQMRMQKIKVSGNLLRLENEIKELNQNKQQIINQQKTMLN